MGLSFIRGQQRLVVLDYNVPPVRNALCHVSMAGWAHMTFRISVRSMLALGS